MAATTAKSPRQRVPAAERRDALIEAAIHEFAAGGLHGTPVSDIARQVGVAQPYVFSLFGSKKELFLAAVERCFEHVRQMMVTAAAEFDPALAVPEADATWPIANAYVDQLEANRDLLLLQHHAYAACGDPEVRVRVRAAYDTLVQTVRDLTGADEEQADEFFRYGMWINVGAAMGEVFCGHREWRRDAAPAQDA